jgi:hypothetical protein
MGTDAAGVNPPQSLSPACSFRTRFFAIDAQFFLVMIDEFWDKKVILTVVAMPDLTPPSASIPNSGRILPDAAVCRTLKIGFIAEFGNCLVERPMECPHVLYFGEGNICRHPKWREFLVAPLQSGGQSPELA